MSHHNIEHVGHVEHKDKKILFVALAVLLLAFAAIIAIPKEGGDNAYQVKDQGGGISASIEIPKVISAEVNIRPEKTEKRSEIELSAYEKAMEEKKELEALSPSEVVEKFYAAIIQGDIEEASKYVAIPIDKRSIENNPNFRGAVSIEMLREEIINEDSANVYFKLTRENGETEINILRLRNFYGFWQLA